jgi:ABC-type bacteriocin/lantibiotic exporter with double-glycine peptidase domain
MNFYLNVRPFQETLNAGYCGPASLKIVLAYYGLDIAEKELANLTKATPENGTEAINIREAAEKFGYRAIIKDNADYPGIEFQRWHNLLSSVTHYI